MSDEVFEELEALGEQLRAFGMFDLVADMTLNDDEDSVDALLSNAAQEAEHGAN